MGILIIIGLIVVVWKVIDLAKQKAAREKKEVLQQERTLEPDTGTTIAKQAFGKSFSHDLSLAPKEKILEMTAAANGLWIRIGQGDRTRRIILKDFSGKTLGVINIKRDNEAAVSAN